MTSSSDLSLMRSLPKPDFSRAPGRPTGLSRGAPAEGGGAATRAGAADVGARCGWDVRPDGGPLGVDSGLETGPSGVTSRAA